MRAPHRQIARGIAQAVLLLVRGVVFFVHHDQAQLAHGREDRHARAEQHARLPTLRARPGLQALAIGQAAVQHRQAVRPDQAFQAGAQGAFQLRRQVDFRHQQQHLAAGGQHFLGGAQVDLGLAAAGHAVQQHRLELGESGDGVHGLALRIVQFGGWSASAGLRTALRLRPSSRATGPPAERLP